MWALGSKKAKSQSHMQPIALENSSIHRYYDERYARQKYLKNQNSILRPDIKPVQHVDSQLLNANLVSAQNLNIKSKIKDILKNENARDQTNNFLNIKTHNRNFTTQVTNPQTQTQINQRHLPSISLKSRFPKPYLQHTKFVDLLAKNRNLIRRGIFDTAVNIDNFQQKIILQHFSRKMSIQQQKINKDRYNSVIKSTIVVKKQIRSQRQKRRERKKYKIYHYTQGNIEQNYSKLLQNDQVNSIQLKNSMNRIIVAEAVRKKISSNIKLKAKNN